MDVTETESMTEEAGEVDDVMQGLSDVLVIPLIKQSLKDKIKSKRLREGAEEITVTFLPPKVYTLSPEEQVKVAIRKQRNIKSANKSRMNRQKREQSLLQELKALKKENAKRVVVVEEWKTTKESMEQIMKFHDDNMCLTRLLPPITPTTPRRSVSTADSRPTAYAASPRDKPALLSFSCTKTPATVTQYNHIQNLATCTQPATVTRYNPTQNPASCTQPAEVMQHTPVPTPASCTQPVTVMQHTQVPTSASYTQPTTVMQHTPVPNPASCTQPATVMQHTHVPTPARCTQPVTVIQHTHIPTPASCTQPATVMQHTPVPNPVSCTQPAIFMQHTPVGTPASCTQPSTVMQHAPVPTPASCTQPSTVMQHTPVPTPANCTQPAAVMQHAPVPTPASCTQPATVMQHIEYRPSDKDTIIAIVEEYLKDDIDPRSSCDGFYSAVEKYNMR